MRIIMIVGLTLLLNSCKTTEHTYRKGINPAVINECERKKDPECKGVSQ